MSQSSQSNLLLGKTDAKDTAHPYPTIQLHPETQHIPLHPTQVHLRPPPPSFLTSPDAAQILVSAAAYRDGHRCATTVYTAFQRATYPKRIRVAVVDQILADEGDATCQVAYCRMARRHFNVTDESISQKNDDTGQPCPYLNQIAFDERDARQSKGPMVARHYLQQLIHPTDEFCLGIDGHSIFTNGWDVALLQDWITADNEMAILTTYVHDVSPYVIRSNGDNSPYRETPHICDIKGGGFGLPRNEGATNVRNATRPILQSKWGAGFAFGKCHAERRVPIDDRAHYIFDGEEFSRAALLWMAGYDMYSPSVHGHVLYHNYTANPIMTTWNNHRNENTTDEEEIGANRIKLHIGQPFHGLVDTEEMDHYSVPNERARTLDQFLNFTGVVFGTDRGEQDWHHTCHPLHWVPYKHPEIVEAVVPGWKQEVNAASESVPCETSSSERISESHPYQETTKTVGGLSNEEFSQQVNAELWVTNFVLVLILLCLLVDRARRKGR